MSDLAIEVKDLHFSFGGAFAMRGLSLEVRRGEVFGYLGHNGAGKTTTIRLLHGVLEPSAGEIRVLGRSPQTDGPAVRASTGVLTETPSLDERLTARENLRFFGDLYSVPERELSGRIEALLTTFELSARGDDKVGSYSKGMRQRLALARALLHAPDILFFDEPTSGLDPVSIHRVHKLIEELKAQGRTIFLCTHNLTEAQALCDRIAVLEQGAIIASGKPAELARGRGGARKLEIEVAPEDLEQARQLAEAAGLRDPEPQGAVLKGRLGRDEIPGLVAHLAAAGLRVYRVSPEEPTLEEFYLGLHRQEDRR